MALRLIEFENGRAVIESDSGGPDNWSAAIEELMEPATKEFARSEAAKRGTPSPACGIVAGAYPVDEDGEPVQPWMDPGLINGYRIDIPITSTFR